MPRTKQKANAKGGPVAAPPDPGLPDPAAIQAARALELMNRLANWADHRSVIRQVNDTIWETQVYLLNAGRRHLMARERGNSPGTAVDAALRVAYAEGADEAAIRGRPLRLTEVCPDLPYAIDLDPWAEPEPGAEASAATEAPDPGPGDGPLAAHAAPRARAARRPASGSSPEPRTRPARASAATAIYDFVVEAVNSSGRTWRISDMLAAAIAAGHEVDGLRTRVALRDAATNGAIARIERGLYGAAAKEA